jgi:hypothetical protein
MKCRHVFPVLLLALVLTSSACGHFRKDPPLPVKAPNDVKAEITALGQQVFDDAGAGATRQDNGIAIAPCGDGDVAKDGRFDAVGTWVIVAPSAQTVPMIDAMAERWKGRGWTIKENGTLNNVARVLRADTPEHYSVRIMDNGNGSAGVIVNSDCYVPPSRDMVDF